MRALLIVFSLCLGVGLQAQSQHKLLRKGDKSYKEENFGKAEEDYRKALEKKPSSKGSYNLGNSIYQQKDRFDSAGELYLDAAERATDPVLKSNAYHNLGNAYFNQQKFKESIEAYKNSLRLQPQDMQTKHNLAQAQYMLKQQQQQQQQQQQEGDEQNEDPQDNQDQQEQQQQQQQEEQDQQQQQNQSQQEQQESQSEQAEDVPDLTREEAERLLKIMENEEQKTMEKMRRRQTKGCKSQKDW
ncbi:MAG: tetratricopeptide repeat protein [Saprospiraceae bacterium]|nr:tetratricopeptide repeat protein [Saprospiraceae bacterium]